MENTQINLKILLPRNDYNMNCVDEILLIKENEYKILNCQGIEVSTKYLPSAIEPGEIFIYVNLVVNEIKNNPIFMGMLNSALYDLSKFLASKAKIFLKDNKYGQKFITMDVHGKVEDQEKTTINFDISCNSESVLEITNKLSKINEFFENKKFNNINIIYNHELDEWRINNKCENNISEG
ncbi:hypothetical protein J2Z76_002700 [Sedimentibacter acidaminivorans]|uniref:Uncharacterized protein n=1 Tax=Sedimentibacter acidaminivorans TaxID=913099 RepID=A0ABS4GGL2_9FIRM|nr:hypothetical protein [Sedimentibacter acidaminivorans]MBP1926830.1 hypothetical protein [Sedimentibacter acidaminivorans]